RLSELHGREVLRWLREDVGPDPSFYNELARSRPDLLERVVFVTGDVGTLRTRTFLAEVQRPTIEKPFTREDLETALAAVCGARASDRPGTPRRVYRRAFTWSAIRRKRWRRTRGVRPSFGPDNSRLRRDANGAGLTGRRCRAPRATWPVRQPGRMPI